MYRGFVIDKETITELPRLVLDFQEGREYSSIKENIESARAAVKMEILGRNGIIDADKVMKACMPQGGDFDIFISHSHADVEYANNLSDYIFKKFGLKCFIDSNYWLNSEKDIQKPFDQKYKDPYSNLRYTDILASTAHVHAMLSMSLLKMMDSCECCIFIRPEQEYIPSNSVYSPWIYEEITMFNYIQKTARRPIAITESFSQKPKFEYRCDLSNMAKLTYSNLNVGFHGYEWLDYLYKNNRP